MKHTWVYSPLNKFNLVTLIFYRDWHGTFLQRNPKSHLTPSWLEVDKFLCAPEHPGDSKKIKLNNLPISGIVHTSLCLS